jgi:hypothetical protein
MPAFGPLSCGTLDLGVLNITKRLQLQKPNDLIEQRCEGPEAGSTNAALMEIQQECLALLRQGRLLV